MKTYIAKWPDESISILTAEDKIDLFNKLDMEGDPFCCELREVASETFRLSFRIYTDGKKTFFDIEELDDESNLKKIELPKRISVNQ
jgi:protein associated with RNAse G/E